MKVMVDPGHYSDHVNQSPVDSSYFESATVWRIANYLAEELRNRNVLVGMTRTNIDENPPLLVRGHDAAGYDLFVSIHTNATAGNSESANWPVCFVQVSGASTEIGNRIGKTLMPYFNASKWECYPVENAEHKDYYGVLRGAAEVGVTGLIVEHGFHTNRDNVKLLKQDSFLREIAKAEAETIYNYLLERERQSVQPPSANSLYGIVCNVPEGDVLNVRTGAGSTYDRLKAYPALGNGNKVDIVGRNDDQSWLYICIAGEHYGWVSSKYMELV